VGKVAVQGGGEGKTIGYFLGRIWAVHRHLLKGKSDPKKKYETSTHAVLSLPWAESAQNIITNTQFSTTNKLKSKGVVDG
jgi:hypothetical protein